MSAPLGVRLVVGQQTLDLYAEVRILDPQPTLPPVLNTGVFFSQSAWQLYFNLYRVLLDDLTIPKGAVLGSAFLGFEIHMDHTKTLSVTHRPFEIIHQRPG